jgi:hypothetical protein
MDKGYPGGTSVREADLPSLYLAVGVTGYSCMERKVIPAAQMNPERGFPHTPPCSRGNRIFLHGTKGYPGGISVQEAGFFYAGHPG